MITTLVLYLCVAGEPSPCAERDVYDVAVWEGPAGLSECDETSARLKRSLTPLNRELVVFQCESQSSEKL